MIYFSTQLVKFKLLHERFAIGEPLGGMSKIWFFSKKNAFTFYR